MLSVYSFIAGIILYMIVLFMMYQSQHHFRRWKHNQKYQG